MMCNLESQEKNTSNNKREVLKKRHEKQYLIFGIILHPHNMSLGLWSWRGFGPRAFTDGLKRKCIPLNWGKNKKHSPSKGTGSCALVLDTFLIACYLTIWISTYFNFQVAPQWW